MRKTTMAVAVVLALGATAAGAQTTLYKLIHPNGKVEYAEKPPKDFPGKVVPVEVDPERNKATLGKGAPLGPSPAALREERVRAARDKVEAARAALKDAQDNPVEGDMTAMGKVGGGARMVPSAGYEEKIAKLQKAVKDAETALAKAEGP